LEASTRAAPEGLRLQAGNRLEPLKDERASRF